MNMKKITPFLWFDKEAEEAAKFYVSIFPDSKIHSVNRMGEHDGAPVMTVSFELSGTPFTALNGGPQRNFKFNESISFMVDCDGQEEVDEYWNKLTRDGGEESMCGWLKDKFGISWQIIPKQLMQYMGDPNPEKAKKAMDAMLKMRKIIIADLESAVA
jgi:predicted 3-demethylubiquinone-9 3-methyltransferase (glyoxalase superfamily)